VQAGAGSDGGDDMAAGGGSGRSWRARGRAAREGNRAGTGRGQRVEVIPAGGGAAAAAERRLARRTAPAAGKQNRQHVPEEEEERGGGLGNLFVNSNNFKDLSVKKDFPLI
jgi:hypothetical protein